MEEGESFGVIVNKTKILAILDTLKNAYANGNNQVSYNYNTAILYHSSVKLGDADPIQIQIEFYPRNQEVKINPGLYMEVPEENIYQQQGDFTSLRFEGIGTGGHDVLHIDIDSDNVDVLKNYLYGQIYSTFNPDSISQEVEDVIDIIEANSNYTNIATCNICVRQAIEKIVGDRLFYPIHLNNPGKISRLGKANDIYNDFLRWFYLNEYNSIKSTYVDLVLQDNIDWEKDDCIKRANKIENEEARQSAINNCNAVFDNKTIEDYRSNIEITEFEIITNEEVVTVEGVQYNVPDYNELQNQVNNGVLIIGVLKREELNDNGYYKSGHIVILVPITESQENDENRPTIETSQDIIIKYPRAMECGGPDKDIKWLGNESLLNMKWYRYK